MVSRADHRRQTLLSLCSVAVSRFERDGFDVTIAEIAQEADVSARTVHRYVDGKEDLAFVHFDLGAELFCEVAEREAHRPFAQRFALGLGAVSTFIGSEAPLVRRAVALWPPHAALSRGYAVMFHRWVEVFANEARRRAPELERFRSSIIGSALMGIIDASMAEWVARDGASSIAQIVEEGLQTLGPGFLAIEET